MFGQEGFQNESYVMIPPADFNAATTSSAWIDMSQYGHATVVILVGEAIGATLAVTLDQATTNAGAGSKTLAFTRLMSTGQKLNIDTVVGTFSVGETLTQTGGNSNTAEIYEVANDYLLVRCLTNGTTWTNDAVITGGTSGATAAMNGTGEAENIVLPTYTAPSSTFTIPATTYKSYIIEVDGDSLDVANDYDHFQVDFADPGQSTIMGGIIILKSPRNRSIPMPDALGAQKMTATF